MNGPCQSSRERVTLPLDRLDRPHALKDDSLALALFELDDLHVRNIALDGLGLERCLQTPAHDLGTDVGVPKVRNACLTPLHF